MYFTCNVWLSIYRGHKYSEYIKQNAFKESHINSLLSDDRLVNWP